MPNDWLEITSIYIIIDMSIGIRHRRVFRRESPIVIDYEFVPTSDISVLMQISWE